MAELLWTRNSPPFMRCPSRFQVVRAALQMFHPLYKYDIMSLGDIGPGLALMGNVVRSAIGCKSSPADPQQVSESGRLLEVRRNAT